MAITISGDGISSDAIASLAASKLTGQVPDANAPSGSVLQVVHTTITNAIAISGSPGSFSDVTGLSATITPQSASSKILITYYLAGSSNTNAGMHSKLQRNGSDILLGDASSGETRCSAGGYYMTGGDNEVKTHTISYLDSPNTTSSITYKIVASGGGNTLVINRSVSTGNPYNPRCVSGITLMEIAG